MRTLLARAGLVVVALGNLEVAVWGLTAPHSFYANFPGFGHHWVASMGPYDEHLVRDYAAGELGMAIWFERRLVLVGALAFLAGTLPHFAYHLTTTDMLKTADNVTSVGSFVLEMALVGFAMVVVMLPNTEPKESSWPASRRTSPTVST